MREQREPKRLIHYSQSAEAKYLSHTKNRRMRPHKYPPAVATTDRTPGSRQFCPRLSANFETDNDDGDENGM